MIYTPGSSAGVCMLPEHSKPGDTVVQCNDCGHLWPYSDSKELAACPKCGLNTRVMAHQRGMVLSSDERSCIEIDQYSQTVRRALSLGLKQGDRDYRNGIAEAFPTKDGGSREF